MKFSQENTLKFIQHSDLFPLGHTNGGLTFTLQHIHCCLKISIMRDYKDFTQSSDANVLDQKYYPLIIDGDKLKDNYYSITRDSKKSSVDVVFVTESNDLIFTEYKFNKISFNEIFKTLSKKINDSKTILFPLKEKYSFYSICYVLYREEDINQVKDIYRQKCDEIDDDSENIYKKCQPMSLEEWYNKFFR